MVEMGYQDETVEMEPQEGKGREETLVCRDHLDHEVNVYIGKKYSV